MGHNRNTASKPAPPKRPLAGFFIYKADQFAQVKTENPDAKVTEITKIIADNWVSLDKETKQQYDKKHQQEREKYEREVKEYEAKYGPIERKKRKPKREEKDSDESDEEQQKDKEEEEGEEKEEEEDTDKSIHAKLPVHQQDKPAPPKRPLTAFFLFKIEVFDEVKKNNPEAKITELTKIICERWKELDEQSKLQYQKKNNEAKEKYEKELKEYVEKFGPIEKRRRKLFRDQNGGASNQEDNDRKANKSNWLQDDEDEGDDDLGEPCNKVFI